MIVTCEECSTSFQLDEARIPITGARVRCSKCKHAFFLPHPDQGATESQALDAIAEEAAGDSLVNVPTATPDLSSSTSTSTTTTTNTLGPSLDTSPEASPESEPDEEDWQFSEEIRVEGDDDADAGDEFGIDEDFGDSLDPNALSSPSSVAEAVPSDVSISGPAIDAMAEAGEASGLELDGPNEPVTAARDASGFGSVDDFSSLMEEDDVSPVDLSSDSGMEIEQAAPVSSENSSVYSEKGSSDDLGDPESWDLVGSDDFAVSPQALGALAGASASRALAAEDSFTNEFDTSGYEEEVGPVSPVWARLATLGRGVGWAATLVMVGAAVFLSLSAEWNRGTQKVQTVSAGPLSAETTRLRWVETSRAGTVLVVEGRVRNNGSEALWPGAIQFALLDSVGVRLKQESIQAGDPIEEVVLREGSTDEVLAATNAGKLRFSATPLAPGQTRIFEAIALENHLSAAAGRVLLEMSAPAQAIQTAAAGSDVKTDEGYFDEESEPAP